MTEIYLVFEEEEIVVRLDEVVRFESCENQPTPSSRFGEQIPEGKRTRVHTVHTGFFYTEKSRADLLDLIGSAVVASRG